MKWLDRTGMELPCLTLCLTEADFKKARRHLRLTTPEEWLSPGSSASTHTYENATGGMACVVCCEGDNTNGSDVVGSLAHEATHIKQHYFEYIGEHHPGTEEEAYIIGNITRTLCREYARLKGI